MKKTAVSTALEKAIKNIRISTEHLDSFERALAGLLDNKKNHQVRQIGFNITYLSELPLKKQLLEKTYFSSMDTGHLLEDVFDDDYLSVWYTIGTAKIRREYGDEIYADFLRSFEHALVILLSESEKKEQRVPILPLLRKLALCLIIRFFNLPDGNMYEAVSQSKDTMMIFRVLAESCPCIASVLNFKQLQFKRGWEAASTRSKHMHRFLYEIFSILVWSIPSLSTCSLLLRGSCAQGVMSIYSDVDFEISNEEYPIGFLPAEELLSGILRVLGIEHEGSTARPTEIDLVSSNGNTRDLHEWMELTVPDSSTPNKGWVNGMFSIDPAWRFYSEYESQKHHLTPKYLFFRIRAIIERLSLQYGINKVSIVEKLQELCSITDFADGKMLLQMTKRCLNCYESPTIDFDELIELNRYIETLYAQMRIRYHG